MRRFNKPDLEEDGRYSKVRTYLPISLFNLLKKHSEATGLPISKLIACACDNEFDQSLPFNYPWPEPTQPYIENAYIEEAQKIVQYLTDLPRGIPRDSLLLARRDMEIQDRNIFALAYRELLHAGLIVEIPPPRSGRWKSYPEGYKYVKLARLELTKDMKKRKNTLEGMLSEIQRAEKLLADKKAQFAKASQEEADDGHE